MGMRLIATKALRFGGRSLSVGEQFEAKDRDARILVSIGHARAAGVEPEPPPADSSKDDDKRRYKRRDLRAES